MNPKIRAIAGPLNGTEFVLGASDLCIGRAARNDIRLDDPLVSLRHCCVSFEDDRCLLRDLGSEHGTFVGDFRIGAKILAHGEHFRAGRTIFVSLLDDEIDEACLRPTANELRWCQGQHVLERTGLYEAGKGITLAALLRLNTTINSIRSAEQVQAHALEFLFQVMPVERAAIMLAGHDEERFISSSHRSAGSGNNEAFPIDEAVPLKVLCAGVPDYKDKAVCCPMTTFDTKVGVLYATMARSAGEWFTAHHIELLESIAASTAIALEHLRYVTWLEGENRRLNELFSTDYGMIGESERIKEVYRFISRAGPGERPVLILGASGTGKELAAYAIHRNSPRSGKRFIPVNCGAFSESLLQSELFGYERGAFTGAVAQRKGLFEEADGCTVFLDEIGELPLSMQPDLLRVIQQGEVKRLGGNTVIQVDVRIIAATNRNLREEVQRGGFREDLFYRINVLPLEMPALAERGEDIPLLAAHFIRKYRRIRSAPYPEVAGISPEAHHALAAYSWPGNVRELENAVEWAISMGVTPYILAEDLPKEITAGSNSAASSSRLYDREFEAFQRSLFERILRETGRNRAEAARRLGWHQNSFRRRCSELGL